MRPEDCGPGQFYEFDRSLPNQEIGTSIPRTYAILRLKRGLDIYTPMGSDAKSLAKDVQKGKAEWEGAHQAGYFPHYHAADNHVAYGHVFYGQRGFRAGQNRRLG